MSNTPAATKIASAPSDVERDGKAKGDFMLASDFECVTVGGRSSDERRRSQFKRLKPEHLFGLAGERQNSEIVTARSDNL